MAETHVCETHKETAKAGEAKELALVAGAPKKAMTEEERLAKMAEAAKVLLECMGEDPKRPGLLDTPMRMAKALSFFTQGYRQQLADVVGRGIFEESEQCDGMVLMRDIEVWSMCEHHAVPFYGKCHIAYLPAGRLLGLSKLARICELFSRRLQVQERLTQQIAEAVQEVTRGRGAGVVMECVHMCVNMRGVQKNGATTLTSHMLGEFRSCSMTRDEFLNLIKK